MAYQFPKTAHGLAVPASDEDLAKEEGSVLLCADDGSILCTDSGAMFVENIVKFCYTHPNLHRRIDDDPIYPPGVHFPFVHYDADGNPYKQTIALGVWDGVHSYRTTTTWTHDEESETSEIP